YEVAGNGYLARVDDTGTLRLGAHSTAKRRDLPALQLATTAAAREGSNPPGERRPALAAGGTVTIARGPVVERITPVAAGVEQSWELAAKPAGLGDFVVRVHARGLTFAGDSPAGLRFVDRATHVGVQYGHATWIDASGRRTPVHLRFAND